jgi:pseudouridine-5'-phosphate glycosidase
MIAQHKKLGLDSGILIAVPIPEKDKALGDIVNNAISDALKEVK